MQLMASVGREFGDHPGLGWIAGDVVRMTPSQPALKIPHMGWNQLSFEQLHPLFFGLEEGAHVYFVHSYVIRPADQRQVLATCDYGGPFAAAVGRNNIVGTQFHPEKSQAAGLAILRNFLGWKP
jgi:glutamine amidotransferase